MKLIDLDSFVSLDTSTTSAAFAYYLNNNLHHYGIIKFNGPTIYTRLSDMAKKIEGVFCLMPTKHIIIESSFYSVNPKTATNLALAQGAILGAASVMGVESIASVTPVTWQSFINNKALTSEEKRALQNSKPGKSKSYYATLYRQYRKQRTIDFVNTTFALNVSDDNVADAIGLGYYVLHNKTKVNWE